MPKHETRNTCVLSMAHLAASTVVMIRSTAEPQLPFMAAPLGPDMIMAYCHTENGGEPPIPADLWACMEWARRQPPKPQAGEPQGPGGYDYILFDTEKEPSEDGSGLPVYEGDDVAAIKAPPGPWSARQEPAWFTPTDDYHGGQRCIVIEDSRSAPVAYVLADEDDDEAAGAVQLVTDAPEIAKRYAALVKILRDLTREACAHDDAMGDEDQEGGARSPTGDDYNDLWSIIQGAALAAEAVIGGR